MESLKPIQKVQKSKMKVLQGKEDGHLFIDAKLYPIYSMGLIAKNGFYETPIISLPIIKKRLVKKDASEGIAKVIKMTPIVFPNMDY